MSSDNWVTGTENRGRSSRVLPAALRIPISLWITAVWCLAFAPPVVNSGELRPTQIDSRLSAADFAAGSDDYNAKALGLAIEEANYVAAALRLPENLPIKEKDLVQKFIVPPRVRRVLGLASIATTNYIYSFAAGSKFSFLTGQHLAKQYDRVTAKYRWPLSMLDTNAAHALATQWLSAVAMDVAGLERDCRLTVEPIPAGGDRFVPIYWVTWSKRHKPPEWKASMAGGSSEWEWKSVATVTLILPTKTIMQLRVNQPEYIMRRLLEVTNAPVPVGPPLKAPPPTPATRSKHLWFPRADPQQPPS